MGKSNKSRPFLLRGELIVGYIAFINGKGIQVVMDDNGVHLEESIIKCEVCDDDRVFKDGTCFKCHELINYDKPN
jgi:hypothetical protein